MSARKMSEAVMSRHSILLVQFNTSLGSRTFIDYATLGDALDGVCALYEKELKTLNPSIANITYDIADLYAYLDQLLDVSLLVFHDPVSAYLPRNKEWIKRQLFSHLRGQAPGPNDGL